MDSTTDLCGRPRDSDYWDSIRNGCQGQSSRDRDDEFVANANDSSSDMSTSVQEQEVPKVFPKRLMNTKSEGTSMKMMCTYQKKETTSSFFNKIMENARSILSMRCSAIHTTTPLIEEPTKDTEDTCACETWPASTSPYDTCVENKSECCVCEDKTADNSYSHDLSAGSNSCSCCRTPASVGTPKLFKATQDPLVNDTSDKQIQFVAQQQNRACSCNRTTVSDKVQTVPVPPPVLATCACATSTSLTNRPKSEKISSAQQYSKVNTSVPQANEATNTSPQAMNIWTKPPKEPRNMAKTASEGSKPDKSPNGAQKRKSCNVSNCPSAKRVRSRSNMRDVRHENNQCAFIGSPCLNHKDEPNRPKPNVNIPTTKSFGCCCNNTDSNQLIQMLSELATQEKGIKNQLNDLLEREKHYDTMLNDHQRNNTKKSCSCKTKRDGGDFETVSQELRMENCKLKSDLMEMKLDLRHCLEKVEGPMKAKLEAEKAKCICLQTELSKASQNMVVNKDMYEREMNSLKLQLCIACSNMTELNGINKRLQDELSSLDCMCVKLEEDLVKQKLSEAETIRRLKKRCPDVNTDKSEQKTDETVTLKETFKCDSNLHVIARKLSKTLKDSAPCEECAKLPEELASAARCIRDLTDMVERRKVAKPDGDGLKKDSFSQSLPRTETVFCQCVEQKDIGAGGETVTESAVQHKVDVTTVFSAPPAAFVEGQESAQGMQLPATASGAKPIDTTNSNYFDAQGDPRHQVPPEANLGDEPCSEPCLHEDAACGPDRPCGQATSGKVSPAPAGVEHPRQEQVLKSATASQVKPPPCPQSCYVDGRIEAGVPADLAKLVSDSGWSVAREATDLILNTVEHEISQAKQPATQTVSKVSEARDKVAVEKAAEAPAETAETQLEEVSEGREGPQAEEPSKPYESAKISASTKSSVSTKPSTDAEPSTTTKPSASAEPSATSKPSATSEPSDRPVAEVPLSALAKDAVPLTIIEKEEGNFPFTVTAKGEVMSEPPAGLNVTTVVTASGNLEVITEGPQGLIETTLNYNEDDGTIEVITQISESPDVEDEASSRPSSATTGVSQKKSGLSKKSDVRSDDTKVTFDEQKQVESMVSSTPGLSGKETEQSIYSAMTTESNTDPTSISVSEPSKGISQVGQEDTTTITAPRVPTLQESQSAQQRGVVPDQKSSQVRDEQIKEPTGASVTVSKVDQVPVDQKTSQGKQVPIDQLTVSTEQVSKHSNLESIQTDTFPKSTGSELTPTDTSTATDRTSQRDQSEVTEPSGYTRSTGSEMTPPVKTEASTGPGAAIGTTEKGSGLDPSAQKGPGSDLILTHDLESVPSAKQMEQSPSVPKQLPGEEPKAEEGQEEVKGTSAAFSEGRMKGESPEGASAKTSAVTDRESKKSVPEQCAEQPLKGQKRDCACQSTPQTEQSCQCCECKDVGVPSSQDTETITEDKMTYKKLPPDSSEHAPTTQYQQPKGSQQSQRVGEGEPTESEGKISSAHSRASAPGDQRKGEPESTDSPITDKSSRGTEGPPSATRSQASKGPEDSISATRSQASGGIEDAASATRSQASKGPEDSVSATRSQASGGTEDAASATRSKTSKGPEDSVSATRSQASGGIEDAASATRSQASKGPEDSVSATRSQASGGIEDAASATRSKTSKGPEDSVSATRSQASRGPEDSLSATRSQASKGPEDSLSATRRRASKGPDDSVLATKSQASKGPDEAAAATRSQASKRPEDSVSATRSQASEMPDDSVSATRSEASKGPEDAVSAIRSHASKGPDDSVSATRSQVREGPDGTVSATRSQASRGPEDTVSVTRSQASKGPEDSASPTRSKESRGPEGAASPISSQVSRGEGVRSQSSRGEAQAIQKPKGADSGISDPASKRAEGTEAGKDLGPTDPVGDQTKPVDSEIAAQLSKDSATKGQVDAHSQAIKERASKDQKDADSGLGERPSRAKGSKEGPGPDERATLDDREEFEDALGPTTATVSSGRDERGEITADKEAATVEAEQISKGVQKSSERAMESSVAEDVSGPQDASETRFMDAGTSDQSPSRPSTRSDGDGPRKADLSEPLEEFVSAHEELEREAAAAPTSVTSKGSKKEAKLKRSSEVPDSVSKLSDNVMPPVRPEGSDQKRPIKKRSPKFDSFTCECHGVCNCTVCSPQIIARRIEETGSPYPPKDAEGEICCCAARPTPPAPDCSKKPCLAQVYLQTQAAARPKVCGASRRPTEALLRSTNLDVGESKKRISIDDVFVQKKCDAGTSCAVAPRKKTACPGCMPRECQVDCVPAQQSTSDCQTEAPGISTSGPRLSAIERRSHPSNCECVDCLCFPKIQELAQTVEFPVVKDEKQIYQVSSMKCNCINAQNAKKLLERTKIPLPTTPSGRPPKIKISPVGSGVCDCNICSCSPCADPKKAAAMSAQPSSAQPSPSQPAGEKIDLSKLCDCKDCKCEVCYSKPPKTEPVPTNQDEPIKSNKNCCCPGDCTCPVCPTEALQKQLDDEKCKVAQMAEMGKKPSAVDKAASKPVSQDCHPDDCDCTECACPNAPSKPPAPAIPSGTERQIKDVPLDHPEDCDCTVCACPGAKKSETPPPPPAEPAPAAPAGDHPEDCSCPECVDCPEGPGKKPKTEMTPKPSEAPRGMPPDCDCGEVCSCPGRPSPGGDQVPPKPSQHKPTCDCATCKCAPCQDEEKAPQPRATAQRPKGIAACDCPGVCACTPCADPAKQQQQPVVGDRPSARGERPPQPGVCDCGTCACPPKDSVFSVERPPAISHPPVCTCAVCDCPNKDKVKEKCEQTGREVEHPLDCDCPECECFTTPFSDAGVGTTETIGTHTDQPECDCDKCVCPHLEGGIDAGVSFKENKETHPKDCDCPECRCADIPPAEGPQAAQMSDDKGCCCPDCKCFDCYKLKDTSAHTLDCKCGDCRCVDCPKQMGQKGTSAPISAKPSERAAGTDAPCPCGDCKCDDCYRKRPRAPVKTQCTCDPCLCKECTFDHGAAGAAGAAGVPGTASKAGAAVPPADESAVKSRSCHCVDCECDVCSNQDRKPNKVEKEVVAKSSVANKSCHCVTCVCKDCIDAAMKAAAPSPQSGDPRKQDCTCTTCTCKDCLAKKAAQKVDQPKSSQLAIKSSQLAAKSSQLRARTCQCMSCICADCKSKSPGGLIGYKISETPKAVTEPSDSKQAGGKGPHCKCLTCTCSKCQPVPSADPVEPSACHCDTCQCEDCKHKAGERPITISAHVSQASSPQPTGPNHHKPDCKCATCDCFKSCYKDEEKLIATVSFKQSETSKPPSENPSPDAPEPIVSSKRSEHLNTSESSHRPSHPTTQFTDPPPFEVPQKLPCDCRNCTCVVCREQAAAEDARFVAQTTAWSDQEAPPFEVPVRMPCVCETCTCPTCAKDLWRARPPSQPIVPQHADHRPLPQSLQPLAEGTPAQQPPTTVSFQQASAPEGAQNRPASAPPGSRTEKQCTCVCPTCTCPNPGVSKMPSAHSNRTQGEVGSMGRPVSAPPSSRVEKQCVCPTCTCPNQTGIPNVQSVHSNKVASMAPPVQSTHSNKVASMAPPVQSAHSNNVTSMAPPVQSAHSNNVASMVPPVQSAHSNKMQVAEVVGIIPVSVPPRALSERSCTCPNCTCPDPMAPNVPTTQSKNMPSSIKSSRHSGKTTEPLQDSQHPPGCICEKCNCFSEVIEVVDISTLDDDSLRKKIQTDKQENCECREQIKEIKKALNRIKCACNEAEVKAYKSKPLVKQASVFGQTMSGLKLALSNLQEKCKAKDKMIEAMTGELKTRTSSNYLDRVLNTPIPEAPDYDKAEDVKTMNAHGEPMTDVLYDKSALDSKITRAMETEKAYKSKKKSCKCGKSHKTKDNQGVNLAGFEVTDIRRITQDSIIIKWRPPKSSLVNGYDIFVNGVNKSKVMSGGRTSAMIHSLDLTATIQITIYAVTKCGRCEPPAIAIYEIR